MGQCALWNGGKKQYQDLVINLDYDRLHYLVSADLIFSHMTRSLEAKLIVLLFHNLSLSFQSYGAWENTGVATSNYFLLNLDYD